MKPSQMRSPSCWAVHTPRRKLANLRAFGGGISHVRVVDCRSSHKNTLGGDRMIRVRGDYIKRILLIASFILMGTVHVFAAQLGEGWLPVRLDDEIATAAPGRLTLRGRHEVLVYVAEPGPARVFVRSVRVGRYEDEVSVIVDDQQASGLAKLTLQPAERGTLEFEAPKRGLYRLVVETGLNAAEVIPETEGWVIPARQGQEIHSIFAAGPLYFFVPQDLRSFEVWGREEAQ